MCFVATDPLTPVHSYCVNFGRGLYRTFDGYEYNYAGECSYTMAEDANNLWSVRLTMVNCDVDSSFLACHKVGGVGVLIITQDLCLV